jgi:hypothetical protein
MAGGTGIMKEFDEIMAESCLDAETWENKHNRSFDEASFFIGYSYCIHDIIQGKLPRVLLAHSEESLKKLIKKANVKRRKS